MPVIAASLATLLIFLPPPSSSRVDSLLNIRSGPGTDKPVVGTLANDAAIAVECQLWGESIVGTHGSSPLWDRVGPNQYIADAFVSWSPARPPVPWCATSGAANAVTTASTGLNVRSGPGFSHAVRSQLPVGSSVLPLCLSWGSSVSDNSVWLSFDAGYVSSYYVDWTPDRPWVPWCGQEPPVVTAGGAAAFIAAVGGPAQEGQRAYGVPASVTIAQAILETGWGRSTLTRDDHNYFGMKCFGGPGPVAIGCRDYATTECSSGNCWATTASFRGYRSGGDSYVDHGRQLSSMERYAPAMQHVGDPDRFAREIQLAGYATSPTYADKLIDLMRQHDLYRYDVLP